MTKPKKPAPRKTWLVLLPRDVPMLSCMLADIGSPDADEIAKALGVTASTVKRWLKRDHAPRAAMLALFYATQWGQSQVHARAHNDAVLQANIARNLLERLEKAERQLARLGRIGEFGSANDPADGVSTTPMVPKAIDVPPLEDQSETSATDELIHQEIRRFAREN